jgi:O-succinylhomoserine sulfhydrylase
MPQRTHKLINSLPSEALLNLISKEYDIDLNNKPALATVCASLLELKNCWNEDLKDPIGHLEKCFDGVIDSPFYARNKSIEGEEFEYHYAKSHHADYALATSSGEAAISLAIQSLSKAGDTILVSEKIFGTSKNNFKITESQDGRKIVFITLHDLELWEQQIKKYHPKIIFLESPSNPLAELADLRQLKALANQYDSILIVDSTFAPAPIYQPLSLGVDIVLESATKFIDGQTRVTGGVLATNSQQWFNEMFRVRNAKGYNQVGFNALLLQYNMLSLETRIVEQSKNAKLIAEMLKAHSKVEKVLYLGLKDHPQHNMAQRDFEKDIDSNIKGFGSIIAFTIQGNLELTKIVGNATGISVRANLGSITSILTHPITSTHSRSRLTVEDINKAGVTDNLLRLSVGLEPSDDIIEKLENGLAKI